MSLLILIITALLISLIRDLIYKGFIVWHREAIGLMIERLLCLSFIITSLNEIRLFLWEYEIKTINGS
jgi:hypothetical protein